MPRRTIALLGASCLTTGWLLGSMISPPVARVQTLPERANRRAQQQTATAPPYAELLQWKLNQAPAPPTPRRNPFVFGSRPRVAAPAVPESESTTPTIVPGPIEPAAPAGPAVQLLGIGSTTTPNGIVRTAVMSDGENVHLVKAGDEIAGFAVVDVTEHSATLANAVGARWIVRLAK